MTDPERDLVRHTAALARLELDEAEVDRLAPQFAAILRHFRVLESVEVDDAEPMTGASGVRDVLRADEVRPSLAPDAVLGNAPRSSDGFYVVPKTVGGEE
ncbi:MAG: Asp-tRNA(Asn)/Glu-tRNA(Gln) amidotransferase subunit GatC [Planctomycetota bacterium]|jgi:aspartyl-tRNA(Asn)/glutamyl-tRNA(Gln) amidotransferase subunit C|nr:Asp-tRNA(Asn)/Glu-tRNA(Gln) amidotransferase subunit GatC [Planctomycetota bacterium]MDP6761247.1 Asp-tRNA(Asn)/Glu-tRNA(Gln) amidotransferase subunit GatC [Planctomycetota bacterium]MDP6988368.1 Asp-tRNA(Asn)/Glu-tRNA(Gln) amidotransferase subunit GatC [Planctomycetota bacterium]